MATKWGELFVWVGRFVVSLLVALVIANGLKDNPMFYKDAIKPWLAGIFAGTLCFFMLNIMSKKS
jgi:hypothetical protein